MYEQVYIYSIYNLWVERADDCISVHLWVWCKQESQDLNCLKQKNTLRSSVLDISAMTKLLRSLK